MSAPLTTRRQLAHLVPAHGTFIELGVAAGRFAAEILATNATLNYIGVDRYADHHDEAEHQEALARLARYAAREPILHHSTFTAALPQVPNASADLVYIDGYAHTGQEMGQTLAEWYPKVKPGGILAGHDYCQRWAPTLHAVDAFAAALGATVHVIDDTPFPSWYLHKTPYTRPLLNPTARIALIGNGPSALDEPLGPHIDTFDEVIRFNAYRTTAFEDRIGSKTTIWSTFGHGIQPADPTAAPDKILFVHGDNGNPALPYPPLWRLPLGYFNSVRQRVQSLSTLTPSQVETLIPSSGLLVALWLLEILDVETLHFTGLDHFRKDRHTAHHYWEPRAFTPPAEHDGKAEARLLSKHAQSGRLRPILLDSPAKQS